MPPAKSRPAPDDSRSEASSTKEKFGGMNTNTANGKVRRLVGGLGMTSSLRETVGAGRGVSVMSVGPGGLGHDASNGIQWSQIDYPILRSYRHVYRLSTPSSFKSSYNQIILSRPGIGRLSPTMARGKDQRRQSKDQLANAVRKHFNGLGIQENEAVVDFLYKVRNQDKNFRMRFSPQRPR